MADKKGGGADLRKRSNPSQERARGGDDVHRKQTRRADAKDGDVARVQMDFMFVGAEGSFVDDPRAKATLLIAICKDDGNLAANSGACED